MYLPPRDFYFNIADPKIQIQIPETKEFGNRPDGRCRRCFWLMSQHQPPIEHYKDCVYPCAFCGNSNHAAGEWCPHLYGPSKMIAKRLNCPVDRSKFPANIHRFPDDSLVPQLRYEGYLKQGDFIYNGSLSAWTSKAWAIRFHDLPEARENLFSPVTDHSTGTYGSTHPRANSSGNKQRNPGGRHRGTGGTRGNKRQRPAPYHVDDRRRNATSRQAPGYQAQASPAPVFQIQPFPTQAVQVPQAPGYQAPQAPGYQTQAPQAPVFQVQAPPGMALQWNSGFNPSSYQQANLSSHLHSQTGSSQALISYTRPDIHTTQVSQNQNRMIEERRDETDLIFRDNKPVSHNVDAPFDPRTVSSRNREVQIDDYNPRAFKQEQEE